MLTMCYVLGRSQAVRKGGSSTAVSAGLSSRGPCAKRRWGACPLSLPSPYPCRIPNSLPFKVGFGTYRHNDDKCTHTDYITEYIFK